MIPLHDDNPTRTTPVLTIGIIAACILMFLWQSSLGEQAGMIAVHALGLIPAVLLRKVELHPDIAVIAPPLTLVTSMFLHGGFMHLAGNMLYLWIFGNNIEDTLGHGRFALFYLLCGLAAAGGQILRDPGSEIPMIGASGAISGVLGAYLVLFPRARVLVAIPLGFYLHMVRLPAAGVLGLWFVLQVVSSMLAGDGPGVAWYAHIGGFIAGLLLVLVLRRRGTPLWRPARPPGPW